MMNARNVSRAGAVSQEQADCAEANSFDPAACAQMERLVSDFGRMYCERKAAMEEVARAHHEALLRLAVAADFRDDDTGVHIVRIGYLSEALALLLGEPGPWAAILRKAAPMHDVGKIGIPDSVLKKPGPLTYQEREVMNQHSDMGAQILGQSRIELFQMAATIAKTHHERYDGKGYPDGLSGEGIPLSGRIVADVDFFDALTMDRVYRPAFSDERALQMLEEQRGNAFDPHVVETFLANAERMIRLREAINRARPTFHSLVGMGEFEVGFEFGMSRGSPLPAR